MRELYAGIDLHSNNNYLCIIDETDKRLREVKLENNLRAVLFALFPYKDDLVGTVVESTFNWYWLVDGLMEARYQVHLANPAKNEDTIMALESKLRMIHILKERIKQVEKRIRQGIQLKPEYKKLLTVSGTGTILALTVMLETEEISRFPGMSDFVSYCRNAPSKKRVCPT